jgi:hypothetical protein
MEEILKRIAALEKEIANLKKRRKQGVAWNKEHTNSVVLAKLKEFSIQELNGNPAIMEMFKMKYSVRGWFNKENCFSFGSFESMAEAQAFLETIHDMY